VAVRPTMQTSLIPRVRILINDPAGASQQFSDQDVQDVLDEGRIDMFNFALTPQWTFSVAGVALGVFDYFTPAQWGNWEDGQVLKQYLTTVVTPATSENIVGHWTFTNSTLPPVMLTGKTYDLYRAAADLLERLAARWVLRYSMNVNGQSLQRGNVNVDLQKLAMTYRLKQRAGLTEMTRSDIAAQSEARQGGGLLQATELDYMAQG
jgi:hypothetical protein